MANIRDRIFDVIDENNKSTSLARLFDAFIIALIVLNVIAIVLESFEEIKHTYGFILEWFELFSIVAFTVEYLLRILTSDLKYPNKSKAGAIVLFVFSPLALVDLFAILPAYLPLLLPIDLRILRALRLLRVMRLFKLNRYSRSLQLILEVFREKRSDLGVTVFVTFILLIIASTLMYHIEGNRQPEAFPNIIASFWWAIATLTTVGYGDVYPITGWGKFISGVIALLGIGLVALPTGILSSAFFEKIT